MPLHLPSSVPGQQLFSGFVASWNCWIPSGSYSSLPLVIITKILYTFCSFSVTHSEILSFLFRCCYYCCRSGFVSVAFLYTYCPFMFPLVLLCCGCFYLLADDVEECESGCEWFGANFCVPRGNKINTHFVNGSFCNISHRKQCCVVSLSSSSSCSSYP